MSNTKSVTDLRENPVALMDQVQNGEPVYIFHRSVPKAVMLSIDAFKRFQEMIEDIQDEREARKLELEDKGELIPFETVLNEYGISDNHKKSKKRS